METTNIPLKDINSIYLISLSLFGAAAGLFSRCDKLALLYSLAGSLAFIVGVLLSFWIGNRYHGEQVPFLHVYADITLLGVLLGGAFFSVTSTVKIIIYYTVLYLLKCLR